VHALYCDLRFAADNTVFTTSFARRGLIAEHGISWMLPRIIGHANALDLLLSARRVSSEEALRIGLVNRLYAPEKLREETYAYARELADLVSASALCLSGKAQYHTNFQGLNFAVCADFPALCSGNRRFKSAVAPVYSCLGKSTLRMM